MTVLQIPDAVFIYIPFAINKF